MQKAILFRQAKYLGVIFAVWTGLALIPGIQVHAYVVSLGHPITWAHALMPSLLNNWIWAVLTPGVFWLSGRYPIERRAWARVVGIHFLGSVAFAVLHVGIRCPFLRSAAIYNSPQPRITLLLFRNSLFANYYDDLWTYSALVAFWQLWAYYKKDRDRELRTTRLEAQLAQAQLQVLKMQLNPHFLFNTLHAISSLMHEDVEAADNMVTRLSDLLRMSLENLNEQEIPFKREMEFLEGYLNIQQIRFRDRLRVRVDIPVACLDALVPNMILQPLVENAVTHGIATRSTSGEIQIRACREQRILRVEVADDGCGIPERQEPSRDGIGLANTKARLRQLYGEEYDFRIEKRPDGGTVATLEIPYRVADESHAKENIYANSHGYRG